MGALERLRELEARGLALSRNRHFDLFEEPSNRRALTLHRYLDALAEELLEQGESPNWFVEDAVGDGRCVLHITGLDQTFSHQAFLTVGELRALEERVGMALLGPERST